MLSGWFTISIIVVIHIFSKFSIFTLECYTIFHFLETNLNQKKKKAETKKSKTKIVRKQKLIEHTLTLIIYNYGLHEKLISIIIKLRKGYFPFGPRENNPFSI
jgi:hypothetical protein